MACNFQLHSLMLIGIANKIVQDNKIQEVELKII